jgi:hypothetical protein|tara:strand:- start:8 stop:319 length:312 start_codon:yes stop_codon:yes gene_type:complete
MSSEVNFWPNKKMQNFDDKKKRKLLRENITRMEAVSKFINVFLIPVINQPYKNGHKKLNFLSAAEKLHYLQSLCEGRESRNKENIKTNKEELIKTCVKIYDER